MKAMEIIKNGRNKKKKTSEILTPAQLQIYDAIFHEADKNMRENGMWFPYGLSAFHSIIGAAPNIVRADEFANLSGEDFIVAAYVRCLGRLPDDSAWKVLVKLNKQFAGKEADIHYALLSSISGSTEFACGKRRLIRLKKPGKESARPHYLIHMGKRIKAITFRFVVIPVWKLTPNHIRNIVRVCTGREKKP